MKTLYALIFACLSLQACGQSETATVASNINEYSTASEYPLLIVGDDDYTAGLPEIKPIDGAEFEGTSRDDAYAHWGLPELKDYAADASIDDFDVTGGMISPASKPIEDETWPEFWLGDDVDADITSAVPAQQADDVWVEFWFGGNAAEAP
jgi:hypothetical protein